MGHYDDLRYAQAERQRKEQLTEWNRNILEKTRQHKEDQKELTAIVDALVNLREEIDSIKEAIAELYRFKRVTK